MNIVAIVLIIVGLAIIYFAVKLMKGYIFIPMKRSWLKKDENFKLINADIAERRSTEIPNYSGAFPKKETAFFRK